MQITRRRTFLPMMDMIALTDIIMNVFIFFFVSFSLLYTFNPTRQVKIPVNLPKSRTAEPQEREPLQITINREGLIYVDRRQVALEKVRPEVEAALAKNPERVVLLRGDQGSSYGRVVQVLEQAREAGAKRLGLAAEQKKK